jgi:aryl-alcohol dehydrogenase-like predicted oxidoreductase
MEYRTLGRTELEVSPIAIGGATFGREIEEPAAWALLDRAVERGINFVDTAESYSERASERMIGRWLSQKKIRQQIVLATKCGFSGPLNGKTVATKIDQSLECLQTDWIDLYQLHHWPEEGDSLDEILEAMSRGVEQGKIRYLGLSNSAAWQLCKALWHQESCSWSRFDAIQPSYSLADRQIEADMVPLCRDQGIGIVSYSPIAGGFLAGKYTSDAPIPKGTRFDFAADWRDSFFNPRCFALIERLRAISDQEGRSLVDLALAWALTQPDITSVLTGGRRPDHVDQAFAALERGLSPELRQKLDRASDPVSFA